MGSKTQGLEVILGLPMGLGRLLVLALGSQEASLKLLDLGDLVAHRTLNRCSGVVPVESQDLLQEVAGSFEVLAQGDVGFGKPQAAKGETVFVPALPELLRLPVERESLLEMAFTVLLVVEAGQNQTDVSDGAGRQGLGLRSIELLRALDSLPASPDPLFQVRRRAGVHRHQITVGQAQIDQGFGQILLPAELPQESDLFLVEGYGGVNGVWGPGGAQDGASPGEGADQPRPSLGSAGLAAKGLGLLEGGQGVIPELATVGVGGPVVAPALGFESLGPGQLFVSVAYDGLPLPWRTDIPAGGTPPAPVSPEKPRPCRSRGRG